MELKKAQDIPQLYFAEEIEAAHVLLEGLKKEHCPCKVVATRPSSGAYLAFSEGRLCLHSNDLGLKYGPRPLFFDFQSYLQTFERQQKTKGHSFGPMARALGIKKGQILRIFDGTCGTGKDSFLMGTFGADVVAAESNPWVFLLLKDAERRLKTAELKMSFSWQLILGQSEELIPLQTRPIDVIYFDPMYPQENKKKALPRKEMQYFRMLVNEVRPPQEVLKALLHCDVQRVVVKRPLQAPFLLENVAHSYIGKSARYDMYKFN